MNMQLVGSFKFDGHKFYVVAEKHLRGTEPYEPVRLYREGALPSHRILVAAGNLSFGPGIVVDVVSFYGDATYQMHLLERVATWAEDYRREQQIIYPARPHSSPPRAASR